MESGIQTLFRHFLLQSPSPSRSLMQLIAVLSLLIGSEIKNARKASYFALQAVPVVAPLINIQ